MQEGGMIVVGEGDEEYKIKYLELQTEYESYVNASKM